MYLLEGITGWEDGTFAVSVRDDVTGHQHIADVADTTQATIALVIQAAETVAGSQAVAHITKIPKG